MHIEHSISGISAWADSARCAGHRVALVPTMGALHEGHLALVDAARARADRVIVSIFVNPTQFGPGEDFEAYPRDLEGDRDRLAARGADVVFAPAPSSMYPGGDPVTWVQVDRLGDHLCGKARPGHFRGVATVVTKLFTICRPHVAVFGLKDAQQFFLLRRVAGDLNLGVELVGVETFREPDGLALSSRNRYLSAGDRVAALALSRSVREARRLLLDGERDARKVAALMHYILSETPGVRPDYAEVVDTDFLQPLNTVVPGSTVLAAVAAFVGKARLIDNAIVDIPLAR